MEHSKAPREKASLSTQTAHVRLSEVLAEASLDGQGEEP